MTKAPRARFVAAAMLLFAEVFVLASIVAAPISTVSLTRDLVSRVDDLLVEPNPARQKKALDTLLAQRFDFEEFESKVLQDAARSLSPAQRRRFAKAFRELFGDYILTKLKEVPADGTLKGCRVTQGKTSDIVTVLGKFKQSDFDVVLYWRTETSPRVTDVAVSDALLSRNYRAMVNKTLREHGFEGLIQKLKEKRSRLTKAAEQIPRRCAAISSSRGSGEVAVSLSTNGMATLSYSR